MGLEFRVTQQRTAVCDGDDRGAGRRPRHGVDGGSVHVRVSSPARIRFVDAGGRTRLEVQGGSGRYQVEGKEGYIRAECVTDNDRAWSQPFWVTRVP